MCDKFSAKLGLYNYKPLSMVEKMENTIDSIIRERIQLLRENVYTPEPMEEVFARLQERLISDNESVELLNEIQKIWRLELAESYIGITKLQSTIVQYEDELIMMMDQMDSLVKCSLLIKQYSSHLKQEIEKVADKVDRKGLDQRIDQLVGLLEEIKPKKHLNLVRDTKIIEFPKNK